MVVRSGNGRGVPRTAALPVEHETFGAGSAFAASLTSNERPVLHVRFADDGEHMLLADQSYWKTPDILSIYGQLVAREVESERKTAARNERKRRGISGREMKKPEPEESEAAEDPMERDED